MKEGTVVQVPVFVQPLTGDLDGDTLILWAATDALPVVNLDRTSYAIEPLYLVLMIANRVHAVMRHSTAEACDVTYKENLAVLLDQGWECAGDSYITNVDWAVTVHTTEEYLRSWAQRTLMPLLERG